MSTATVDQTAAPSEETRSRAGVAGYAMVPEVRWAGLSVVLFALGGVLELAGAPAVAWWAAYLACYLAGGWEPALAGLAALKAKMLDVDLLMIVAAIVAASIGQVLDGALLIIIFATSGALEAVATKRTRDSVTALLDLAPDRATVVEADGGERVVAASQLEVGAVIRVRPGERVAGDGVVLDGASELDQSSVTGESMPVTKHEGDEVFAGTMNGTGALLVRVATSPEQSVIARIVAMVSDASQTKARAQLFVERAEQRYSVIMVAATLALFFIPLALGHDLRATLLRAITFMIVASPCAIVLATMPPLLSAIANAGRHGVLVKSAIVMEALGSVDTVAFDKTGTLTLGTPTVTGIAAVDGATIDPHHALMLAAAAEVNSQHPLGAAIVAAGRATDTLPKAESFESMPGRGVHARVAGRDVQVLAAATTDEHDDTDRGGHTVVEVRVDGRPQAHIALTDQIRDDAADAVRALALVVSHPPVLLTGDNQVAATSVALQVGVTDIRAGLLPHDKVAAVAELQAAGRTVALIGDGVNDAPAMATAHLGIAMGRSGSDLALETADAVIVRDDLNAIAQVIDLSRRAHRTVIANLTIAAAIITGLVIWDLAGHLPLPIGVAGHEGSTVIVGLNGLRLLRATAWRQHSARPPRNTLSSA